MRGAPCASGGSATVLRIGPVTFPVTKQGRAEAINRLHLWRARLLDGANEGANLTQCHVLLAGNFLGAHDTMTDERRAVKGVDISATYAGHTIAAPY